MSTSLVALWCCVSTSMSVCAIAFGRTSIDVEEAACVVTVVACVVNVGWVLYFGLSGGLGVICLGFGEGGWAAAMHSALPCWSVVEMV